MTDPKPLKILVVSSRALDITEELTRQGFVTDEASTADAALPLHESNGYDAILTDIAMPGRLNGLELAHRQAPMEAMVRGGLRSAQQ